VWKNLDLGKQTCRNRCGARGSGQNKTAQESVPDFRAFGQGGWLENDAESKTNG
jgi:hypothetical protein